MVLLQGLALEIRDNKSHIRLLRAEDDIPLDSASKIACNHETLAHGLTRLQITPTNSIFDAPINST